MVRHKVENKEQAILEAAIAIFSERGFWNTPTSLISKTAGVADGTLFNYFKSKDDLINELYLEIKRELAEILLAGLDEHDSVQDKLRHIWDHNIDWGVEHPDKFKVLHQISASYELNEVVKAAANAPFAEIASMIDELIASRDIHDYPIEYLATMMDRLAEMTAEFISKHQDTGVDYKSVGFNILWNGIIR